MKKIILKTIVPFLSIFYANAQENNITKVEYPKSFVTSKPLRDLFLKDEELKIFVKNIDQRKAMEEREKSKKINNFSYASNNIISKSENLLDESSVQRQMGTNELESPLLNFEGLLATKCLPDPTGAIGTSHYVQAVNATPIRIFNKTNGNTIGTIANLGDLWNPAVSNEGDPIVLYDKYADRWILTQFGSGETNSSFRGKIYIAVSKTPDPTGVYNTYTYNLTDFPDYPKFSIWSDGFYMSCNTCGDKMYVFERDKMIAGDANARMLFTNFNKRTNSSLNQLPADADGTLPPYGTPCPFVYFVDGSNGQDKIYIQDVSTNWTSNSISISDPIKLPLANFDVWSDFSRENVLQGVSDEKLDIVKGMMMFRAQWRKWTGYNSLLTCWSVIVGEGKCSTKWVELRQDQTTKKWTVFQEGIFNPDNLSRILASIAMDDDGNIGMNYMVTGKNPNTSPGIRYTGRLKNDPLGEMTFAEKSVIEGSGKAFCLNRIGDYSHMSLDPIDGKTFWTTAHYFLDDESKTRIYSFKIQNPLGLNSFENSILLTSYQLDKKLIIKANNITSDKDINIDLFDSSGKNIFSKLNKNRINSFEEQIDITGLSKGMYLLRIGNLDFQKVIKTIIE